MCRNIRPLNNFEPPATNDEVHAASRIEGIGRPRVEPSFLPKVVDAIESVKTDMRDRPLEDVVIEKVTIEK